MRAAVQREANKLVEEFMLLANMSVAALIADAFPERSLLRRHPPPNQRKLEEVSQLSNSLVRARTMHAALTRFSEASKALAHLHVAHMNGKFSHSAHRVVCVLGRIHAFQASHASGIAAQ